MNKNKNLGFTDPDIAAGQMLRVINDGLISINTPGVASYIRKATSIAHPNLEKYNPLSELNDLEEYEAENFIVNEILDDDLEEKTKTMKNFIY
ncbi:MAG: hypothetical protein JW700_03070 [Candidatus Aenigmarchaeota archaeon]|nr:hypothetical protein [Candidatus Aenigmarchaeota archaeon]